MAGIEKICELTGEYPGSEMYRYKRNHIQVIPKYRKQFKNTPAILVVFKPHSELHYEFGGTVDMTFHKHFYEKINGKWHTWVTNKQNRTMEILKPVRKVFSERWFCLYAPNLPGQVSGFYWNTTVSIGDVKRRIKRMVGHNLKLVNVPMTQQEFYKTYSTLEKRLEFFNNLMREN